MASSHKERSSRQYGFVMQLSIWRESSTPSTESKFSSHCLQFYPRYEAEFEQVVREYKLSPDQYLRSTRLREWARRNKNSKYIPEPLLEAWGFEIESTL